MYKGSDSNFFKILIDYFYLTEIVLTPPKGALYTVVPEKDCYYRFGSHTTALSIQVSIQMLTLINAPKISVE